MSSWVQYPLQAFVYAGIALLIGIFANRPIYMHFPPEQAQIRLTFAHGAQKEDCRERSAAELEELAPNMRKKVTCARERLPVWIELTVDDALLYQAMLLPTGLAGDGPSRINRRFAVSAGPHRLRIRLRDTTRAEGYDYQLDQQIELRPRQNLGIGFRPESGGFILM